MNALDLLDLLNRLPQDKLVTTEVVFRGKTVDGKVTIQHVRELRFLPRLDHDSTKLRLVLINRESPTSRPTPHFKMSDCIFRHEGMKK